MRRPCAAGQEGSDRKVRPFRCVFSVPRSQTKQLRLGADQGSDLFGLTLLDGASPKRQRLVRLLDQQRIVRRAHDCCAELPREPDEQRSDGERVPLVEA